MPVTTPRPVYLKDYTPPDYQVETIDLHFDLGEEFTVVQSRLACTAREAHLRRRPLVLAGRDLELRSVALNGRKLRAYEYQVDEEELTIFQAPDACVVEIETLLHPKKNTSLEGLYRSSGNFCTQCEAEGFRKITYFPDRPDVMARYTTTLVADRNRYPVLLANGNLIEQGELPNNRHFAIWHDPFPKPSYLFALVAGDLACLEDTFVSRSGRFILLQIYVQRHNLGKCDHAMASLKKAMRWEEEVFGLEYDLDRYLIVAVDDFNMGAMENKGLNLFNSKYILADPQTATDDDFENIEAVIGHEYFHNWTGNRVTCRDWFQLSLKEGLTVFRDQEFSAAVGSRAIQRIRAVAALRSRQFPEDASPMAHPVRPDSYLEINNFYTVTVYEKGAEIIRMLQTLLGEECFRRGVALYLERHDGQAVTTDDFLAALQEVSGRDLGQFRRWYSQAGTPELTVTTRFDPAAATYTMHFRQYCPPTPGQPSKKPLHIPCAVGLLDKHGDDLPLALEDSSRPVSATTCILEIREPEASFTFRGVAAEPLPSLLRNFSAPVKVHYDYTNEQLRFLLTHDSDPFSRWEAGQRLTCRKLLRLVEEIRQGRELHLDKECLGVFRVLIRDSLITDQALLAQLLTLPSEEYLAEQMAEIDVGAIHRARQFVRRSLAAGLRDDFLRIYHTSLPEEAYAYNAAAAGQRRLKNLSLSFLMTLQEEEMLALCLKQFREADNMTDALGALQPLTHTANGCREEVLAEFFAKWQHEPLVLDKWLAVQATAPLPDTLARVQQLLGHSAFSIKNPNRVRALIGSFCAANPICFHAPDGSGYRLLADVVLSLDPLNPQIAARLLNNLSRWRRFDPERRDLMRIQLERISDRSRLSRDVYEVASKCLGAASGEKAAVAC